MKIYLGENVCEFCMHSECHNGATIRSNYYMGGAHRYVRAHLLQVKRDAGNINGRKRRDRPQPIFVRPMDPCHGNAKQEHNTRKNGAGWKAT